MCKPPPKKMQKIAIYIVSELVLLYRWYYFCQLKVPFALNLIRSVGDEVHQQWAHQQPHPNAPNSIIKTNQ